MTHHFFIAGGSGFVGSHLVEYLIGKGEQVTVADLMPPSSSNKLASYLDKINYMWKNMNDLQEKDFDSVDYVIYLAAQADVPLAISSPRYTFDINILSLVHVLELLRSKQKTKLIYLSSKNVYGKVPENRIPIIEEETLRPTDPYGASKAAADLTCQSYSNAYGLPITILRSGGIFGPRSRPTQVIPTFIRQAQKNENISIQVDGIQATDFNDIVNLVEAIMLATEKDAVGIYNISYGEEVSIIELTDLIIETTNSKSQINYLPWRPGEKGMKLALSIEKASKELGYHPKVSLKNGIQMTLEWMQNK